MITPFSIDHAQSQYLFDPQHGTERTVTELTMGHEGDMNYALSLETNNPSQENAVTARREPDILSALVWRSLVNDYSHGISGRACPEGANV